MEPAELARRYYECFNDWRFTEAAELVAPDATFHVPASGNHFTGPTGFWLLLTPWLTAFEDAKIEIRSVRRLTDDSVSVEYVGRGTHTGELVLGRALRLPPTGRQAELLFRDRLTVRDGRIIESVLDFDVEELRSRLCGA